MKKHESHIKKESATFLKKMINFEFWIRNRRGGGEGGRGGGESEK